MKTGNYAARVRPLGVMLIVIFVGAVAVIHSASGMAADCSVMPSEENYVGVRYKAVLVEDELSETGWVLLFGGSGFTKDGEYQPHFADLMIKGSWANIYDDSLCSRPMRGYLDDFSVEFGLSDYEDGISQDNDIAMWSRDPDLFPRVFGNIDGSDPALADKIMAEYQVDKGGSLEGREVEVSFVRGEETTLSQHQNYFMDPDSRGMVNSQADILYRHWIATLRVPSLGLDNSVDFYVNASQGEKILGYNTLNFMWENPDRPIIESDRFKVIIYNPEVKTDSGEWKKATRFLVDIRAPNEHLPLNKKGQLVGGYRKVNYKGQPAIEASFGYGYTDYVSDGNPNAYETGYETKGVIDLTDLEGSGKSYVEPMSVTTTPTSGEIFVNGTSWGLAPQSRVVNAGTYNVSFQSISGYQTPSWQLVTITGNGETVVEGVYQAHLPSSTAIEWPVVAVIVVLVGSFAGLTGYIIGKRKSVQN